MNYWQRKNCSAKRASDALIATNMQRVRVRDGTGRFNDQDKNKIRPFPDTWPQVHMWRNCPKFPPVTHMKDHQRSCDGIDRFISTKQMEINFGQMKIFGRAIFCHRNDNNWNMMRLDEWLEINQTIKRTFHRDLININISAGKVGVIVLFLHSH